MESKLTQLRIVGFLEGLSFIALLFIAMPLKYIWGDPTAVKYVGMTHGILFILFIFALYNAWSEYKWSMKFNAIAVLCSLLPFAPFWLETKLKAKAIKVQ